jgi:hypothetical protein
MSLRNASVIYALLGMVAAGAALVVGLDVYRAARRGPRWKRRLLSAGLAVLAAIGIAACDRAGGAEGRQPGPTCYKPMQLPPVRKSLTRVEAQLPVLERLAEAEKLDPAVVRKVLASIEKDLAVLGDEKQTALLPDDQRKRAEATLASAREKVKAIRARLGEPEPIEETAEWKQLTAVWREAEAVGSGRRGDYPFDAAGKKRLLTDLEKAQAGVGALAAAGQLSEAEAKLLKTDLAALVHGVQMKRPTEMRNATCYEPMMFVPPAQQSLKRLSEKLPLLEKMAARERLSGTVVEKVLVSVERDLSVLGGPAGPTWPPKQDDSGATTEEARSALEALPADRRAEAEKTRDAVKAAVQRIRARMGESGGGGGTGRKADLTKSDDWQTIEAAWAAAVPPAKSGESTTAQRKAVDAKLKEAVEAASRLAEAGLLTRQEAGLLAAEAKSLKGDIYRNPPTDCKVTCYDMAYLPPAQQSLKRLTERLPLVEKLAAEGKAHPAALQKVLARMEADLKILADPKQLETLQGEDRERAVETRKAVAGKIEALRNRIGKPQPE